MSELSASAPLPKSHDNRLGPGCVILVVGPSGAGKDTLLAKAKIQLSDCPDFSFPKRLVTRECNPDLEDHVSITLAQFEQKERAGDFALSWRAHGNGYIIPREINQSVVSGRTVVFNASRSALSRALELYEKVGVVQVTVPSAILVERLQQRGRESVQEVIDRLERSTYAMPSGVDFMTVVNDKSVQHGTEALIAAIRCLRS